MGMVPVGPVKGSPCEACRTSGLAELYQSSNAPVLCSLLSSACNCSLRFETLRGISQTLLLRRYPSSTLPKAPRHLEPTPAVSTASTSIIPILSYNFGSIMTSFIPSPALPSFVFEQLAISILLGRASGIRLAVRSAILLIGLAFPLTCSHDCSRQNAENISCTKTTSLKPSSAGLWPSIDFPIRHHGLRRLPSMANSFNLNKTDLAKVRRLRFAN